MRVLNMLNDLATSWETFFANQKSAFATTTSEWLKPLMNALSIVMWIALALVGAAGGIYAIYVGIKMARADSAEAREENKKRFINILVSIVVVLALILIFNVFLPMIFDAVINTHKEDFTDPGAGNDAIRTVVNTVRCLIGR